MDTDDLQPLRDLTAARARAKVEFEESVREAFAAGCSQASIARAAGVTRARIEQMVNPGKSFARQIASQARESGELVEQPCERCATTTNIEMHHDDYSDPMAVRWLCEPCHKAEHVEIRRRKRLG